jgi:uncharacterized protein (DUF952 family)
VATPAVQVKRLGDGCVTLDGGARAGHLAGMHIYKILRAEEWAELERAGETAGAPIDVADGYIHFSTADQVAETAAKHFAGVEGLVLAAFEAERLTPLRWEPSRGGALFPHLYGPLRRVDVLWHAPLHLQDGRHVFPGGL